MPVSAKDFWENYHEAYRRAKESDPDLGFHMSDEAKRQMDELMAKDLPDLRRLVPAARITLERLERIVAELTDRNEKLYMALSFARGVIKCREEWSEDCDRIIDGALHE